MIKFAYPKQLEVNLKVVDYMLQTANVTGIQKRKELAWPGQISGTASESEWVRRQTEERLNSI